jgi:hypothetical protein
MPFQIFNESMIETKWITFDDSNSPGYLLLRDGNFQTPRIDACLVSNDDTIDHVVYISNRIDGHTYVHVDVNVPAGSGHGGVAPVDIVAAQAPIALGGLLMGQWDNWQIGIEEAVNTGKQVNCVAIIGDVIGP